MEDLPHKFSIENSSLSLEIIENNTREITAGAYLISIIEIVNSVSWKLGPVFYLLSTIMF